MTTFTDIDGLSHRAYDDHSGDGALLPARRALFIPAPKSKKAADRPPHALAGVRYFTPDVI
jgi:hypothetical protein